MNRKFFSQELFTQNLAVMRSVFMFEHNSMQGMGALLYTLEGRLAESDHIEESIKALKAKQGIFSEFRSHLKIPIVIKMSLAADPQAYLQGITDTYKALSASFHLGDESRLLAAIIMYDNIPAEEIPGMCDRTMEIYQSMKKEHPFLTNQGDLPFAVLMAAGKMDMEEQLGDVEACYQLTGTDFLLAKDAVQTVSHILSMSAAPSQEKSDRFLQMYDAFKKEGMKISTECMPILAVLTNSELSVEEAVRLSSEYDSFLKTQKGFGAFGTGTEVRRLFAAGITAITNIPEDPAAFGALSEVVLSIIVAIEIALMVTIVATASAATTSN